MERHEIEVFLTLADELHFGRTAERLGLTQGRVSQTVKKLERRFRADLFERTSRRVALTPLGKQLREGIETPYRRIQEEIAEAVAAGRGITGTLRIGFSGAFTGHLVQHITELFEHRHPGVEFHLQQIQLFDPFGPLRAGDVDVQVTERPVEEPDLSVGPVLIREPRALLVSDRHRLARRETVSIEDWADCRMLTVGGRHAPQYWLDHLFPTHTPSGRAVPRGPAVLYWEDAMTVIRADQAVCPLSSAAARYYTHTGVAYVPVPDAPPLEYGLVWPKARSTKLLGAFVRAAQAEVAARGGPDRALASLTDDTRGAV
ncbi:MULTISPECIES: LysR family transcriptional regulator [unclassified Streptomyces]|uniref:LysR family transcriptional regulator n=1 Tax=unclassified Streptomyces TaxID=2593676 RepID=UPI00234BCFC2|nr:LysR family transcriptional regulator [Streptomyces sp. M92]WCN04474.1 LysR family transcriptional regulator [Streptomyces sp. M92]